MTITVVNVGNDPNDGTGTPLRDAMIIINDNFLELHTLPVINSYATVGNATVNSVLYPTALIMANNLSSVRVGNTSTNTISNSSGFYTTGAVNTGTMYITSNTLTLGTSTAGANGYTWLPNGLKMNWGWVAANNSIGNAIFSSAFSVNAYVITATSNSSANTKMASVIGQNSTCAIIRTANATYSNVFYMAIGK